MNGDFPETLRTALLAEVRRAVADRLGCGWPDDLGLECTEALAGVRGAGVFVTVWTEKGELRGCVGSVEAQGEDLAEEARRSALLAAFEDPRFPPLRAREFESVRFEISVLGELEEARGIEDLDPGRYGIYLLATDHRRAVLLPGIAGLETAESQMAAARRKGEIREYEVVSMYRFPVTKIREPR